MNFKAVAVVILWAVYLYGLFLDIVRYRSARNPIPQNVADVYDRDTCLKRKASRGEKVRFGIFCAAGFAIDEKNHRRQRGDRPAPPPAP